MNIMEQIRVLNQIKCGSAPVPEIPLSESEAFFSCCIMPQALLASERSKTEMHFPAVESANWAELVEIMHRRGWHVEFKRAPSTWVTGSGQRLGYFIPGHAYVVITFASAEAAVKRIADQARTRDVQSKA